MAIKRMNHAVLYVRNADRTFAFYRDVLGFRVVNEMPGAKFLQAPDSTNDHDLGIFEIGEAAGDSTAGRATVGLYHIAWEVQTLADLRDIAMKLADAGALVGATDHSTTKALYGKDPDGLEFEVCWLVPQRFLRTTSSRRRRGCAPSTSKPTSSATAWRPSAASDAASELRTDLAEEVVEERRAAGVHELVQVRVLDADGQHARRIDGGRIAQVATVEVRVDREFAHARAPGQ